MFQRYFINRSMSNRHQHLGKLLPSVTPVIRRSGVGRGSFLLGEVTAASFLDRQQSWQMHRSDDSISADDCRCDARVFASDNMRYWK